MKSRHVIIISVVGLLVIVGSMSVWYAAYNQKNKDIDTFDECVAAGHPVQASYPERCAVPNGKTYTRAVTEQKSISVEGRTICLSHKNMDGPHTMECAIGLQTDNGKSYGLSTDPYNSTLSVTDRRVRVEGTLQDNIDSKYQSEGTITVSSYELLD